MASTSKMLKDAGIKQTSISLYEMGTPTLEEIKQLYPPSGKVNVDKKNSRWGVTTKYKSDGATIEYNVRNETQWHNSVRSEIVRTSCYINGYHGHKVAKKDGKYCYSWRGNKNLESPKPLTIAFLAELNKVKEEELEKGKQARRTKIKTPLDAVRVTLIDLGYDPSMQDGALRVYVVGCCHIQLRVTEPYDVQVLFGHYDSGGGGASSKDIARLNLADPAFKDSLAVIMSNADNLLDIIAGRKKNMESYEFCQRHNGLHAGEDRT